MGMDGPSDIVYCIFGIVGCAMVAFAQIPNIMRVHKRKQSMDISYTYQLILALGVTMFAIYYAYYESLLVYPTAFSLIFILYLAGLKLYIEEFYVPRVAAEDSEYSNGVTLERALLSLHPERSDDRTNTQTSTSLI